MIMPPSRLGEWRPEREQVMLLEPKLVPYVTSTLVVDGRKQAIEAETLARYRRLYVGTEQKGRRRIQVYLLCDLKQWPKRIAWPRGGGACYIQATWDVKSASFIALNANSKR
jgi:hypothetical protein